MRSVTIHDMTFRESYTPEDIARAVESVAQRINSDYEGRDPLFVCVLNGAFIYAADLLRRITLPCRVTFVRFRSYDGTSTTGEIKELIGLSEDVYHQDVIVIEDIVDTGYTMHYFKHKLEDMGAASVRVTSLLFKPEALRCEDARPDYVGIEVPKQFCIGYGLDLDDYQRNLDALYTLQKPS